MTVTPNLTVDTENGADLSDCRYEQVWCDEGQMMPWKATFLQWAYMGIVSNHGHG